MDDLALSVRHARPSDAAALARIYIESWQDTYAGLISHSVLNAMSLKGHTARWQSVMRGPSAVLVAEDSTHGPIGLASMGTARDRALGYEGEVYTLYVDPLFLGRGTGRALMEGAFDIFRDRKLRSCLIWAHASNNACFFYERLGGKRVATRTVNMMGAPTPEIGFGWKQLVVRDQAQTFPS